MIAESIIKKNSFLVRKLIYSGRTDLNIIALILCESHFRRNTHRVIEYCAMPILFLIAKERFNRLSIGIAQIQLKHWIRIKKNNSPISMKSYMSYFSIMENYDVLKELIQSNLEDGYNDSKLIAFHTGETRKYHFSLFQEIKNRIKTTPNKKYKL
jgi:hypothetical protein